MNLNALEPEVLDESISLEYVPVSKLLFPVLFEPCEVAFLARFVIVSYKIYNENIKFEKNYIDQQYYSSYDEACFLDLLVTRNLKS